MDLLYHSAKVFATGTADRKFCIFEENRHCARNAAHPTSENGKLAALTSGCPAFQQHVKRAEGSDTTPHLARSESTAHRVKKQQHHQVANRSRSPAGPRRRRKRTHAIGVHPLPPAVLSVAISLAAQDRAVAEGGKARVSPCEPLCAILLRKPSVYPLSCMKANVGRL